MSAASRRRRARTAPSSTRARRRAGAAGVAAGLLLAAAGIGAGPAPIPVRELAARACTTRVGTAAALTVALSAAPRGRGGWVICLGPGRYRTNLDISRPEPVTLWGSGTGATVLAPTTTQSVVTIGPAADVTLARLTVTGGLSGDPGGLVGTGAGIHTAGTLTLEQVAVSHNGCALMPGPGRPGPAADGSCQLTAVSHHTINAGGIYNTGRLTLIASSVTQNSGFEGGGLMNNHQGVIRLEDHSQVDRNGGPGTSDGGGIYNHHAATLVVSDSTVADNRTGSLDSSGGGIFNQAIGGARGRVVLVDAQVVGNSAQHIGGGILNRGTLSIQSSQISGNHAGNNGGGILNVGALTVTSSRLEANTAGRGELPYGGGAVYNAAGSSMTMSATLLSGNQARYGAAVDDEAAHVVIRGSTLESNGCLPPCGDPTGYGTLYSDVGAVVTVSGTTIADNSTGRGGIFDNYGVRLLVSGSRISGNQDGGVYNQGHPGDPAQLQLVDSTLSGNLGAGGLLNYGVADLVTVTVSGNRSSSGGGGIANAGGVLVLTRTVVRDNRAAAGGGGVLNLGGTVTAGPGTEVSGNQPNNCQGLTSCPGTG